LFFNAAFLVFRALIVSWFVSLKKELEPRNVWVSIPRTGRKDASA